VSIVQGEGDDATRGFTPAHLAPVTEKAPVEQKVTASSRGAGLGGALAAFIIWALGRWAFHGDVPGEVSGLVIVAVPTIGAALDGWRAPHTPRPDLLAEET
jgi:hypothetical protein